MEGEVEVPFEQSNDEDYNNSENHTGEVEDKMMMRRLMAQNAGRASRNIC